MTTWTHTHTTTPSHTCTTPTCSIPRVCAEVRVSCRGSARCRSWKAAAISRWHTLWRPTGGWAGKNKNHKEGVSILSAGRAENCIFCHLAFSPKAQGGDHQVDWIGQTGSLRRQRILQGEEGPWLEFLAFSLDHLPAPQGGLHE